MLEWNAVKTEVDMARLEAEVDAFGVVLLYDSPEDTDFSMLAARDLSGETNDIKFYVPNPDRK